MTRSSGQQWVSAGVILVMLFLWQEAGRANQSISFRWAPNPETNIVSYRVHYGLASRAYSQIVSVGNTNRATISNLVAGNTYYFAVTAMNSFGLESGYSGELSYSVPFLTNCLAPAGLRISLATNGHALLLVVGTANGAYQLQASTNLVTWSNIGTVTIASAGSAMFTDSNATKHPRRYYRAQAAQPPGTNQPLPILDSITNQLPNILP